MSEAIEKKRYKFEMVCENCRNRHIMEFILFPISFRFECPKCGTSKMIDTQ